MKPTETTLGPIRLAQVERIKQIVAKTMDLNPGIIMSQCRRQGIPWARMLSMVACLKVIRCTLCEVGYLFNRDHGTVLNAIRALELAHQTNDKQRIADWVRVVAALKSEGFNIDE